MDKNKSIALLGSKGFIGSNLLIKLNAVGIDSDNYNTMLNNSYKYIMNCNGNSSKLLPDTDPIKDFDLTVTKTMKSVFDFDYDTYVYISSCEVYGDLTGDTKEDTALDPSKMSRYAFSKYLAESIVKKHCKKWLILRLNGPVGTGMKKGPIYDILNGDKLWISPESKMQFMHTDFICNFINSVIQSKVENEVFNLTGTDAIELKDAMYILEREVPGPENPVINTNIDTTKSLCFICGTSSMGSLSQLKGKL